MEKRISPQETRQLIKRETQSLRDQSANFEYPSLTYRIEDRNHRVSSFFLRNKSIGLATK